MVDTGLITRVASTPIQRQAVTDLLVLDEVAGYTEEATYVAGYEPARFSPQAMHGLNINISFGLSPATERALTTPRADLEEVRTGLLRRLGDLERQTIQGRTEYQDAYIRIRDEVLIDIDSNRDLPAARTRVQALSYSDEVKTIITDLLILADVAGFINTEGNYVAGYEPARFSPQAMRGLNMISAFGASRATEEALTARSADLETIREGLMNQLTAEGREVYLYLRSMMDLPESESDLIRALCTLDGAQGFCPNIESFQISRITSALGITPETHEDIAADQAVHMGDRLLITISGNHLPENPQLALIGDADGITISDIEPQSNSETGLVTITATITINAEGVAFGQRGLRVYGDEVVTVEGTETPAIEARQENIFDVQAVPEQEPQLHATCTDGVDNDNDTFIDADDLQCRDGALGPENHDDTPVEEARRFAVEDFSYLVPQDSLLPGSAPYDVALSIGYTGPARAGQMPEHLGPAMEERGLAENPSAQLELTGFWGSERNPAIYTGNNHAAFGGHLRGRIVTQPGATPDPSHTNAITDIEYGPHLQVTPGPLTLDLYGSGRLQWRDLTHPDWQSNFGGLQVSATGGGSLRANLGSQVVLRAYGSYTQTWFNQDDETPGTPISRFGPNQGNREARGGAELLLSLSRERDWVPDLYLRGEYFWQEFEAPHHSGIVAYPFQGFDSEIMLRGSVGQGGYTLSFGVSGLFPMESVAPMERQMSYRWSAGLDFGPRAPLINYTGTDSEQAALFYQGNVMTHELSIRSGRSWRGIRDSLSIFVRYGIADDTANSQDIVSVGGQFNLLPLLVHNQPRSSDVVITQSEDEATTESEDPDPASSVLTTLEAPIEGDAPPPPAEEPPVVAVSTPPQANPAGALITLAPMLEQTMDQDNSAWQRSQPGWTGPANLFGSAWVPNHLVFAQEGEDTLLNLIVDNRGCPGSCGGRRFAGGEYRTAATTFGPGSRYEARVRGASGRGHVTGFFIYNQTPWDEIDIVEILGQDCEEGNNRVQLNHYVNGQGGNEEFIDVSFNPCEEFANYGLTWTNDSLIWTINGEEVHRVNSNDGGAFPTHSGRIFVNHWVANPNGALAGWAGTVNYTSPVTASVDWIRYATINSEQQ